MTTPRPNNPGGERMVVMQATSSAAERDGTSFAAFSWTQHPDAVGYNLYRVVAGSAPPRRLRPINGNRPVAPVTTCAQLTKLVARDTPEWNALTSGLTALAARRNPATEPVDPCAALERGLTKEEELVFDTLAGSSLNVCLARGLAYIDRGLTVDEQYLYELRGVLEDGSEIGLVVGVPVWGGRFVLPDPPSGLSLLAGDRRVLALWNRNPYAYSFAVQRSTAAGGPFQMVNPQPVKYDVDSDLDGQPISPPRPGYLDYQYWSTDGLPESHVVDGEVVVGPENDTTYYYRVASRDGLGRLGAWSPALPATPRRTTLPMAPDSLQVSPQLSPPGLVLSWRKVTFDVDNHQLPDSTQSYAVYRATSREDLEDLSSLPARKVGSITADPQDPTTATLSWTDTDPILVPPYGQTTFFYRLRCTDPYEHTGAPSAVIAGCVPDTTPPGPTQVLGAEGFADYITVYWKPNTEPDLAGYQIYRGVCDLGSIYVPPRSKERCDVSLVGQVSLADSEAMLAASGRIQFEDHSVPAGSPICYAYWVRAYDFAQNLYQGHHGCPASRSEYTCMRLHERTPPPPPIVTGLRARDNGVLLEWIASPVQDLRAFHVYRSAHEHEPPVFLACVFTDGTVSPTPWRGLQPVCADIPAVPNPVAAHGQYLDSTAVPHEVYWYRVSALDWLANESDAAALDNLPSSSTFTYTNDLPATPALLPQTDVAVVGCGLDVQWGPTFDSGELEGFVVFRSTAGAPYRQVSGVLPANGFSDGSARRGVDYWYCVQSVDKVGTLSVPSVPVLHRY